MRGERYLTLFHHEKGKKSSLSFPFDPMERSKESEALVIKGGKRLYHKFRAAPYYGGIATADAVGCSFLCAYCWSYFRNLNPSSFSKFYSPEEVGRILLNISRKKSFQLFRVTGSEPILGEASFDHLLEIVRLVFASQPQAVFILETNGLFLGYKHDWVKELSFRNLWVRVSIKGTDKESFERITGARSEFFRFPFIALKELQNQGIRAWPALMSEFSSDEEIRRLRTILREQGIRGKLELEVLEPYPFVLENLEKRRVPLKRSTDFLS